MNLIKQIVALLTGRKLVWLRDFDGAVVMSIATPSPFGGLTAKRYWPMDTRTVTLGENGKVEGGGYVHDWKYVKEEKATL